MHVEDKRHAAGLAEPSVGEADALASSYERTANVRPDAP